MVVKERGLQRELEHVRRSKQQRPPDEPTAHLTVLAFPRGQVVRLSGEETERLEVLVQYFGSAGDVVGEAGPPQRHAATVVGVHRGLVLGAVPVEERLGEVRQPGWLEGSPPGDVTSRRR